MTFRRGSRRRLRHDITYGTNNEFGFDYLRDNMKYELAQMVQRRIPTPSWTKWTPILIDEARTPLIISARSTINPISTTHRQAPSVAEAEDYDLDEKQRSISLTDAGNGTWRTADGGGRVDEGALYEARTSPSFTT